MKNKLRLAIPLLFCGVLALNTCDFDNQRDPVAVEDLFIRPFPEIVAERNAKRDAIAAAMEPIIESVGRRTPAAAIQTITPINADACCWTASEPAALHPFDATQHSDNYLWTTGAANLLPAQVINNTNTGNNYWAMNSRRPVNDHFANRKHTEIPASQRIDIGNHWLTVELAQPAYIIGITYRGASAARRINAYRIFASETPLGHYCPPGSFVHQGSFADSNQNTAQTVNFDLPLPRSGASAVGNAVFAKYLQIRVLSSHNDNGNDGSIANLQLITIPATVYEPLAAEITEAYRQFEDELIVDYSYLATIYKEGLALMDSVRSNPVRYNMLAPLMFGERDENGFITAKGAADFLFDDPDEVKPVLSQLAFTRFFAYQEQVDTIADNLAARINQVR